MDLYILILIIGCILFGFYMIREDNKETYRVGGPSEANAKNIYGEGRGCNMYGIKDFP
jgi:hypothetical protein